MTSPVDVCRHQATPAGIHVARARGKASPEQGSGIFPLSCVRCRSVEQWPATLTIFSLPFGYRLRPHNHRP